jgi:protein crumbs
MEMCFGNKTCDPMKCDCNLINCEPLRHQYKSKEFVYHLILWPLLAIMVSLLIILLSIFLMRVKKSRATRGTYSPSRHELQASRIEFNMDLKRPPEERLI